jgi:hypothetical protein
MARTASKISALVERQLPEFISYEYPKFTAFLEKYYEQLELPGQPLDIIQNLTQYQNIDFYEKHILQESSDLVSITNTSVTISDASGFPDENGYILIDDEIIFYKTKTNNTFTDCFRNVSGTTKLGDLYNQSVYQAVDSSEVNVPKTHLVGSTVYNISNLFLYAFVRNFETQYLASFPEESLKPQVNKQQLLKNIRAFYQSKGTEQSIKFIFNAIVSDDPSNVPSIYYPKDSTLKSSVSGWVKKYAIKVKLLSGDIFKIIGQKVVQVSDIFESDESSASGIIDNVTFLGNYNNEDIYEVILASESVVGKFEIAKKTFITKNLSPSDGQGKRINVFSTIGWKTDQGKLLIGSEQFFYNNKNINQFTINSRTGNGFYGVDTPVYDYKILQSSYEEQGATYSVKLVPLGVVYNLSIEKSAPYSSENDTIQIADPGFDTRNPIVYNIGGTVRWKVNTALTSPPLASLSDVISNISAVYEDENYYYVASSGFPDYVVQNLNFTPVSGISISDQKHLKLIRKEPSQTTEIYPTSTRDVGVFVNGATAQSYKDYDSTENANSEEIINDIVYGGIASIEVLDRGRNYKNAPYVLIDGDRGAQAKAIMLGEVIERIEVIEEGEDYQGDPVVTITSGRNAEVEAIVTKDRVTSLKIINPGEYYSSPPIIRIIDENNVGRLAEYTSIISSDGKLIGFEKINEGKFYTQENIRVYVDPVGDSGVARAYTKRWKKNRYEVLKTKLDSNNGFFFLNYDKSLGYGYSHVASPTQLRTELNDVGTQHSPILGYAYDGNPIYGPHGFTNPLNGLSSVTRMTSSYKVEPTLKNRPKISDWPIGTLVEDYKYQHRLGTLDENNGRFCVTPEYPNGTYAYFITVNSSNVPVFPYILGENFYSIPVDANYNKAISQDDIPSNVKKLRTNNIKSNGTGTVAIVETINSGKIDAATAISETNNFSVGSPLFINNSGTEGIDLSVDVSLIKGKNIVSIESQDTKAKLINTVNSVYLFDNSIVTQQNTGATGQVVGDIVEDNRFVLRNVTGNFNLTSKLDAAVRVILLLVDREAFYTKGSLIKLTNGKQVNVIRIENNTLVVASNPFDDGESVSFPQSGNGIVADKIYFVKNGNPTNFQISETLSGPAITLTNTASFGVVANNEYARGEILDDVFGTNTVRVKVLEGEFFAATEDYLRSENIDDTLGARIFRKDELSKNIEIKEVNDNISIVKTNEDHFLTENDKVFVDIDPNDSTTTTNYYVRKRIYQKIKLEQPQFITTINDTGIGSAKLLNAGADYANGGSQTFTNVELIFADQNVTRENLGAPGDANNAKATITVNTGKVTNVTITTKGSGYVLGDLLVASNSSLQRLTNSLSQSILYLEVSHVGLGILQNTIYLSSVEGLAQNDYLKIDDEIVKVTSVNTTNLSATIQRPFFNTTKANHFNGALVTSNNEIYNFTPDVRLGTSTGDPYVKSYDPVAQELLVYFDINQTLTSISAFTFTSTFFDNSAPSKLVKINSIIEDASFRFEFSKDTSNGPWLKNPIIEIQEYYKYKFITSHPSLSGTYLEFSPSGNYNILVTETQRGSIIPGSGDENTSYITVKFGYGSALESNTYDDKFSLLFNKIFYFDKSNIVENDSSYLSIIPDPLQGEKSIIYVTPRSFVYSMDVVPQYDGSGDFSYTTSSKFANGKIDSVRISNPGSGYKKLPTIYGGRVASKYEALATTIYNSNTRKIDAIDVSFSGSNYVNPVAALIYKNTVFTPKYKIVTNNNGGIVSVINEDTDLLFDEEPLIYILEGNVNLFFESDSIGTIKNIKIIDNGSNYYDDYSILPYFTSHQILLIKDFPQDAFVFGEIVEQIENNEVIASGRVSENGYKNNINVLKLYNVKGEFKPGLNITGKYRRTTCKVTKVFASLINAELRSYYDNSGYYSSDTGKVSEAEQRITDSYFYQDYSYVIKSKSTIDKWKKLIKQTSHPAGFNLFGEVSIDSEAENSKQPLNQPPSSSITVVELWDEKINRVTVESTKRTVTQNIISFEDLNVNRGKGSVYLSEYDTSETQTLIFKLAESFDGDFDESGNRSGRKTFQMVVPKILPNGSISNQPLNVAKSSNLIITLDGILQEPEVAYTVSGSQITFSQPPLGQRISQNQIVDPQTFVGRFIKFKSESLNNQYFRKIKNIDHLFDSEEGRFSLYYTDGTNVQLGPKENLIVSLDGILQENKMTPLIPATSAYYINRNVVPNEIVFTKPPVSLGSQGYQHFFAFSVGNYERIKIDENLIGGSTGPFLMTTVLDNRVINIDNDRNLLVFLDGVLQIRNRAYSITGPFISFSNPLKSGQKVNILFLYGRDIEKTLTFYNFQQNDFFNLINITIDNYGSGLSVQQIYKALNGRSTIYQGNSFLAREAIGEIMSVYAKPSTQYPGKFRVNFRVKCQNNLFNENLDLKITDYNGSVNFFTFSKDLIEQISPFEQDEETREIVRKVKTNWLSGTSLPTGGISTLDPGDLVKVDGESEYRKIIETPSTLYKIGHREEDLIEVNHEAEVTVTSYNGTTSGVGLSIKANIRNESIYSLTWNNRNYELAEDGYIKPATAFGYLQTPELIFIPQPELDTYGNAIGEVSGGGASGYVVMDRGEIIDVVLVNPGSGYKAAPKIIVTRGYDIIKNPEKIVRQYTALNLTPKLFFDTTISRVITQIRPPSLIPEIQSIYDLRSSYDSTRATSIVLPKPEVARLSDVVNTKVISELNLTFPEITSISSIENRIDRFYELAPSIVTITDYSRQVTVSVEFGFSDIGPNNLSDEKYVDGTLGNSFGTYENIKYANVGVANLSEQNTIEMMDLHYPSIILADFTDREKSSISLSNATWDATWPSIQEHGGILDISIDSDDDIIYISDTSRFPSSGQLIIGGSLYDGDVEVTSSSTSAEVVFYTGKLSDRFTGVSRGENITVAQSHAAGTYLRSLLDEYRFDLQVDIDLTGVLQYPSYYYSYVIENYIQLVDNVFIPRNGSPFALL